MSIDQVREVLSVGTWLLPYVGVYEWALTKDQALQALSELQRMNVACLGGDVYEVVGAVPKSIGENWSSERRDAESDIQYLNRSIDEARDYIKRYPTQSLESHLFVLVPDISLYSST